MYPQTTKHTECSSCTSSGPVLVLSTRALCARFNRLCLTVRRGTTEKERWPCDSKNVMVGSSFQRVPRSIYINQERAPAALK